MKELVEFIQFCFEHIDDKRIELTKKIKFGHALYTLSYYDERIDPANKRAYEYSMIFYFDTRNQCIDVQYNHGDLAIIEDVDVLNYWCSIFDDYLKNKLDDKLSSAVNELIENSTHTDLYREFKLRKLI